MVVAAAPAPFAAVNSPMPSGMPRMAPGSAGSTCAAARPAVSCRGVTPSARASAEVCLASSTVAQVVTMALSTARAMSTTVSTWSICSSRTATGLLSP